MKKIHDFERPIIKEPSLSYFHEELEALITNSRFVFIQGDPYQNFRNFLNYLKIPSALSDIKFDDWAELWKNPGLVTSRG